MKDFTTTRYVKHTFNDKENMELAQRMARAESVIGEKADNLKSVTSSIKAEIAEQEAKQAAFGVERKKQEAQQTIETARGDAESAVIAAEGRAEARLIEAQAEAEALALIQQAIADNPELLTYQYITKLAPTIDTMLLPSETPFVFTLPEAAAP